MSRMSFPDEIDVAVGSHGPVIGGVPGAVPLQAGPDGSATGRVVRPCEHPSPGKTCTRRRRNLEVLDVRLRAQTTLAVVPDCVILRHGDFGHIVVRRARAW